MSLYIVDIHGELEGDYEIVKKYETPTDKNFTEADIETIVKAINAHWELIIDEIRAEIKELYSYVEFDEDLKTSFNMVRLEEVQRVIDKYKAESEGKE